MDKKLLSVFLLVGVLGIISAVLGFVAEGLRDRIKKSDEGECNSSPSAGLGYGAAVAFVLAKVIILSVAEAWWRRNLNKDFRALSLRVRLSLALFALASLIALFLLLGGATIANRHDKELSSDGTKYVCYYVRPGVFAGGAIMALASVILGTIFYFIMSN